MPKVIPNLEKSLIVTAKRLIKTKGYANFTIQQVAKECKIAMGTMYNYFPSKVHLMGRVILEDWIIIYKNIETECENAYTINQCLKSMYVNLCKFINIYENLFKSDTSVNDYNVSYINQHKLLAEQLYCLIFKNNERLKSELDNFTIEFLVESIITFSMKDTSYEKMEKIFEKIL